MEIRIQHCDPKDQLCSLVERLIKILQFENTYAYQLLIKVTSSKSAVIQLDNCLLKIKGNNTEPYTIIFTKEVKNDLVNFKTTSRTLRKILSGQSTLDKAIADHELYICASFEDIMNIYKLTMCLLVDASLSSHLRNLWNEFILSWNENKIELNFASFENQQPSFDRNIQNIPISVLRIGLPAII